VTGFFGLLAFPHTLCLFIRTLGSSVLELITKSSHAEASVLYKVLGTLRTIFVKLLLVFLT
jgi:hypothetical protein